MAGAERHPSVEPGVESVQREGRLPGRQDGPVDRVVGVVPHVPRLHPDRQRGGGQVAPPDGGAAPQGPLHVVEPLLRHGRVERQRHVGGDGGQVGPRPWHDLDELVAATAERDPPAGCRLVRQVMQRLVGAALGVDGDGQVGQRVVHVGVAAVLADEHVGGEGPHQRRHDRLDGAQPRGVAGARRERDVGDRAARGRAADVGRPAGAGEEVPTALVHRDREHPGVVPEHPLDAVAVVHVDVDVRHPLGAVVEQPLDADADVVVDAEPGRVAAHGVRPRYLPEDYAVLFYYTKKLWKNLSNQLRKKSPRSVKISSLYR